LRTKNLQPNSVKATSFHPVSGPNYLSGTTYTGKYMPMVITQWYLSWNMYFLF